MAEAIIFYTLSFFILASASGVIFSRKPFHCAVFLIFCFFSIAGLYVSLNAEFIAAIQVLVYAGGIMVLFLFMIMLISIEAVEKLPRFHRQTAVALISCLFFFVLVGGLIYFTILPSPAGTVEALFSVDSNNIKTVAMELYRNYFFPFELASFYLLAAMIGAIVLARRKP